MRRAKIGFNPPVKSVLLWDSIFVGSGVSMGVFFGLFFVIFFQIYCAVCRKVECIVLGDPFNNDFLSSPKQVMSRKCLIAGCSSEATRFSKFPNPMTAMSLISF